MLVVYESFEWTDVKDLEAIMVRRSKRACHQRKERCLCLAACRRRGDENIATAEHHRDGALLHLT